MKKALTKTQQQFYNLFASDKERIWKMEELVQKFAIDRTSVFRHLKNLEQN